MGKRIVVIGAAALAVGFGMAAGSDAAEPWRTDQVIEPAELARVLTTSHARKPVLLYVGFPLLYAGGHIPGSVYVGPTMRPEGLEALKGAVRKLPKDAAVVIYCGCCPMERCPNVRPAFRLMEESGFTDVKVLDIPVNLPRDWSAKGYPTEKGGTPQ